MKPAREYTRKRAPTHGRHGATPPMPCCPCFGRPSCRRPRHLAGRTSMSFQLDLDRTFDRIGSSRASESLHVGWRRKCPDDPALSWTRGPPQTAQTTSSPSGADCGSVLGRGTARTPETAARQLTLALSPDTVPRPASRLASKRRLRSAQER